MLIVCLFIKYKNTSSEFENIQPKRFFFKSRLYFLFYFFKTINVCYNQMNSDVSEYLLLHKQNKMSYSN